MLQKITQERPRHFDDAEAQNHLNRLALRKSEKTIELAYEILLHAGYSANDALSEIVAQATVIKLRGELEAAFAQASRNKTFA